MLGFRISCHSMIILSILITFSSCKKSKVSQSEFKTVPTSICNKNSILKTVKKITESRSGAYSMFATLLKPEVQEAFTQNKNFSYHLPKNIPHPPEGFQVSNACQSFNCMTQVFSGENDSIAKIADLIKKEMPLIGFGESLQARLNFYRYFQTHGGKISFIDVEEIISQIEKIDEPTMETLISRSPHLDINHPVHFGNRFAQSRINHLMALYEGAVKVIPLSSFEKYWLNNKGSFNRADADTFIMSKSAARQMLKGARTSGDPHGYICGSIGCDFTEPLVFIPLKGGTKEKTSVLGYRVGFPKSNAPGANVHFRNDGFTFMANHKGPRIPEAVIRGILDLGILDGTLNEIVIYQIGVNDKKVSDVILERYGIELNP